MTNPLRVLWDLVMQLLGYVNTLWLWLNTTIELKIFGFVLFDITPMAVLGGVGLTTLIILWIIRG